MLLVCAPPRTRHSRLERARALWHTRPALTVRRMTFRALKKNIATKNDKAALCVALIAATDLSARATTCTRLVTAFPPSAALALSAHGCSRPAPFRRKKPSCLRTRLRENGKERNQPPVTVSHPCKCHSAPSESPGQFVSRSSPPWPDRVQQRLRP